MKKEEAKAFNFQQVVIKRTIIGLTLRFVRYILKKDSDGKLGLARQWGATWLWMETE